MRQCHDGYESGGVICTRRILWPGGRLVVNADAREGEVRVRVSDEKRKVLPGFDYGDCTPLGGDGVAQEVSWQNATIESLAGKTVRLEIFLKNADVYTFRATSAGPQALGR
ncbi:MAG: hypothetical protein HQ582_28500 [Planctomycetes bacterium]|nr:hypothetical protein [Planctomycetota bacterium]